MPPKAYVPPHVDFSLVATDFVPVGIGRSVREVSFLPFLARSTHAFR